jgi:omega-6 fatty acid desaturase (delta-12 desaturase)
MAEAKPLSIPGLIKKLPRSVFTIDRDISIRYLLSDFALAIIFFAGIFYVDDAIIGAFFGVGLGFILTALFVLGHDAGHRSYSKKEWENDLVGHLCLSWTLWPFHIWRLSHDRHHKFTHHARKDNAWSPVNVTQFRSLSRLERRVYGKIRSWGALQASILFQVYAIIDGLAGKMAEGREQRKLLMSVAISAITGIFYIWACVALGGFYGVICGFIIPQIVFHFWLSTFTLLHHTAPDSVPLTDAHWDPVRAQLDHSFHVEWPAWVDWLTHDISWHVPHHVCVGIPHYRLREAHKSLKEIAGDRVQERKFSWGYLRSVLDSCHLVRERENGMLEWVALEGKSMDFRETGFPDRKAPAGN